MRLALLGVDQTIWELAEAACNGTDDQLVSVYDAGEYSDELARLGVPRHPVGDWELLLHEPQCDAVLVGRGGDQLLLPEQLRRLVQAAIPLVIAHPIADMLLGFELQMIRQDTSAIILPAFPECNHPLWPAIADWLVDEDASPIGPVEQFEWERCVKDRSPRNVQDAFARDCYVQRKISGPIRRLGAMLPGNEAADATNDWSQLSAHMDSAGGTLTRWAVQSAAAGPSRLRIIGRDGWATATLPGDPDRWQLQIGSSDEQTVELPHWKGQVGVLDDLRAALDQPAHYVADDFEHACRAVELADTLEISCRRGRTIDLHHEELTEEGTFKSLMAAGGCLALLLTVGVTFLAAALGPLSPRYGSAQARSAEPPSGVPWLWTLLLFGLLVFLALQFLRLLLPRRDKKADLP